MTVEPDIYQNASLINGLPTVVIPPRPYSRRVTNIVIGNSVSSGVFIYRGSLGSVPVAQNTNGQNNTLSGSVRLSAGQQLFLQWTATGPNVSDAYARVSFERSDNPLGLDVDAPDYQSWVVNPVTQLVLPTNATTGRRIVLDGATGIIYFYDNTNLLIGMLDPSHGYFLGSPDLNDLANAQYVEVSNTDPPAGVASIMFHPGNTVGPPQQWTAGYIRTEQLHTGPAQDQALHLQSPRTVGQNQSNTTQLTLASDRADGSSKGQARLQAGSFVINDVNSTDGVAITPGALSSTPMMDLGVNAANNAGNRAIQIGTAIDPQPGWFVDFDGHQQWGPGGSGAQDVDLFRKGPNELSINGQITRGTGAIGSNTAETWHAFPYANGWADNAGGFAPLKYRITVLNRVEIEGSAKSPNPFNGVIGTLPVGYRPASTHVFFAWTGTANSQVITVDSSGVVTVFGFSSINAACHIGGSFSVDF